MEKKIFDILNEEPHIVTGRSIDLPVCIFVGLGMHAYRRALAVSRRKHTADIENVLSLRYNQFNQLDFVQQFRTVPTAPSDEGAVTEGDWGREDERI